MQPPARQAHVATPFHTDPPAGPPPLQHAGSWQPKPAGPGGLQAPVGTGASSFAASLAPGPPSQQQQQQHQASVSSPAAASPLLSLDPASHAPSPHVGGLAQQLGIGGPSVSQGGELQPSIMHVGGPSHHHQQQQQQQQVELQFGQFGLTSGSFSGGGPAGFGGSYSESPAFGEGPTVSAFAEPSSSAFLDGSVPVLSINESQGPAGGLSHEGSGVAGSSAGFKAPGAGAGGVTAASPSGRASDDFSQQGVPQRSVSIGPPTTSSAAVGSAPGGHYSAFAQPKAQEVAHSHGSGGQYSHYGGYNQHFGGTAAFGQVRPCCPFVTALQNVYPARMLAPAGVVWRFAFTHLLP